MDVFMPKMTIHRLYCAFLTCGFPMREKPVRLMTNEACDRPNSLLVVMTNEACDRPKLVLVVSVF